MGGSSIGAGLWVSDDTAKSWTHIGWKHVKCYSVDVVDSSGGNIIYQACGNGLMRSTDAGDHWRMLTDWRITEVLDVAVNQSNPNDIVIATATGLWESTNEGAHWSEVGEREYKSHLFYNRQHKSISPVLADTLNDGRELCLTENGAVTINNLTVMKPNWRRGGLWCVGSIDSTIILGGERGLFVVDEENVPHKLPEAPRNIHSMVILGSKLYLASLSGGIWQYDGKQFDRSGLETLQVWKVRGIVVQ